MTEPDDAIVLGFDFGMRRIGVALGNGVTRSARGLTIVPRDGREHWRALARLVEQWQPRQLVVGVARHPDGAAHEMTGRCERFARQLEGRFRLPVARVDERYSTVAAAHSRGGAAAPPVDDEAAAVILQQWFEESRREKFEEPAPPC